MRKKVFLVALFVSIIFTPLAAEADVFETSSGRYLYTDKSVLDVKLVRQDPYPAKPGEYVELLFKVENVGTEDAENVTFELLLPYPFSLDEGVNTTRKLGKIEGLMYGSDAYQIEYDVRVDEEAIGGENTIKASYCQGECKGKVTTPFNVSIAETRADLDVTVNSLTKDILSLNVNNIGDKEAKSVTVEIPNQEGFSVLGSSSKVIGNLSAGENTEIEFPISSLNSEICKIILHYTDTQGTRRTVEDEVKVEDVPTEIVEVIPEESSNGQVTLYVVNTGIDPIYSTVIEVPEQKGFISQGSSSSVIGNLDSGDYTVASFQGRGKSFTVKVAYTDRLGMRRIVDKKVELGGNKSMEQLPGDGNWKKGQPTNRPGKYGNLFGSTTLLYISIGIIGIAGVILLVKYRDKLKFR